MASLANAYALLEAGDDAGDGDVAALVAAAPVPKKEAPVAVAEEPKGEGPTVGGNCATPALHGALSARRRPLSCRTITVPQPPLEPAVPASVAGGAPSHWV